MEEKTKCYIDRYFTVRKDYTVKALCEYVGISRQAYSDIVSAKAMPRVNVALKICEFFERETNTEWSVETFWRIEG